MRQAEDDEGARDGSTSVERAEQTGCAGRTGAGAPSARGADRRRALLAVQGAVLGESGRSWVGTGAEVVSDDARPVADRGRPPACGGGSPATTPTGRG